MTPFRNPPPGYHYFVICKYCGRISFAKKKSRKYCEEVDTDGVKRNCNPLYNNNSKQSIVNPVSLNCFGEEFHADRLLDEVWEDRIQVEDGWSKPVLHSVLYHHYQYRGFLPTGEEKVIMGSYVLRIAPPGPRPQKLSFQIKPFTLLLDEERIIGKNRIVKGEFTTFYSKAEGDPNAPAPMTEKEGWMPYADIVEVGLKAAGKTLTDLPSSTKELYCFHHPE